MANNKANRKNIKTKGPKNKERERDKKTINNEIYAPKFILSSFDIIVEEICIFREHFYFG